MRLEIASNKYNVQHMEVQTYARKTRERAPLHTNQPVGGHRNPCIDSNPLSPAAVREGHLHEPDHSGSTPLRGREMRGL